MSKGKPKVSMRDMRNAYGKTLITLGYCEAQYLLNHRATADLYSAGTYGWNCDYYIVYDDESGRTYAIATGYRTPTGTRPPYDTVAQHDQNARHKRDTTPIWEQYRRDNEMRLLQFVREVTAHV